MWRVLVVGLVSTLAWPPPLHARRHLRHEDKDRIRVLAEAMVACLNVPGMSLSVVSTDEVLMEEGFGWADQELNENVTADTIFPIASLSKGFTSTLLAMILSSSKFNLDTPIKEIIGPEFELYDCDLTNKISLRDVLGHRTGVPGYFVPLMAGYNVTMKELIRTMKYHKPIAPLRTTFLYNNFMYAVAGHVAERIGGDSWENLTRKLIFDKLGMDSSFFITELPQNPTDWEKHFAQPYVLDDGRLVKIHSRDLHQVDVASPAGAILSTARDMSKWIMFHLNSGATRRGDRLVPASALRETYEEHTTSPSPMNKRDMWRPTFPVSDVHTAYGLAWFTNVYRGYKRIWHSGGITTYKSLMWLYPDLGLGMYVVVNGPPNQETTMANVLFLQYITDLIMGDEPWINTTTICTFPEPWQHQGMPHSNRTYPDDKIQRPLTDFQGKYGHRGFGEIEVNVKDGKLLFKMGIFMNGQLKYDKRKDRFHVHLLGTLSFMGEPIPLKFIASRKDGPIDMLRMPLYSPIQLADWTEFRKVIHYTKKSNDKSKCLKSSANRHGQRKFSLWTVYLQIILLTLHYVYWSDC